MTANATTTLPPGTAITIDNFAQALLQIMQGLPQDLSKLDTSAGAALCVNSGGYGGPLTIQNKV